MTWRCDFLSIDGNVKLKFISAAQAHRGRAIVIYTRAFSNFFDYFRETQIRNEREEQTFSSFLESVENSFKSKGMARFLVLVVRINRKVPANDA